jgi:putative FmdB family regulatory protein
MPTYEYECKICGHTFDVFQSMSDEPLKSCPRCGKEVRRLIHGGVGVIFKGSGFYVTDKKGGGSSASAKVQAKSQEGQSQDTQSQKTQETQSHETKPQASQESKSQESKSRETRSQESKSRETKSETGGAKTESAPAKQDRGPEKKAAG